MLERLNAGAYEAVVGALLAARESPDLDGRDLLAATLTEAAGISDARRAALGRRAPCSASGREARKEIADVVLYAALQNPSGAIDEDELAAALIASRESPVSHTLRLAAGDATPTSPTGPDR